jgi:hypothetical protein
VNPLKDWKTTCSGVALIVTAFAMFFKVITFEQFVTGIALFGGGGLVAAADSRGGAAESK